MADLTILYITASEVPDNWRRFQLSHLLEAIGNTEIVSVRLLFWEVQMSRVLLILVAGFIGFGCGYLVAALVRIKSGDRGRADPPDPIAS